MTGNLRAPLTVVEFGDFECPACGLSEEAARQIRAQYGDRIRFVFRQFPLSKIHPQAEKAAEASECAAEQGKFWEAVEKLYAEQADLSVDALKRYARELGLDQSRFNQCLDSGETASRDQAGPRRRSRAGCARYSYLLHRPENDRRPHGVRHVLTACGAGVGQPRRDVASATKLFSEWHNPAIFSNSEIPCADARRGKGEGRQCRICFCSDRTREDFSPPSQTSIGACSEEEANKKQPALIGTAEVRQLLEATPKPLFVDVRPAKDYAGGRIPGAINMPAENFAQDWSKLPKDKTIVLYESGHSSGDICAAGRAAGRALLEHGFSFEKVKVYQDGLAGWEKAGQPIQH